MLSIPKNTENTKFNKDKEVEEDTFSLFEEAMNKIAKTSKDDVDKAIKEDKDSKKKKNR